MRKEDRGHYCVMSCLLTQQWTMAVCVCVCGPAFLTVRLGSTRLSSVFGANLTFAARVAACRMCGQWPGPNHSFIDRFHSECVHTEPHAPPLCIIYNKQVWKSILVSIMQTGSSVLELAEK